MREIKFRGKTIDGDKWIHGALLMSDDEAYITEERAGLDFDDIDFGYIFEKVHPETVGQFIGLHDKKNREIYHGDICKIKFDVERVEDYVFATLSKKEIESGERIFLVESPLFNNQPELNCDDIEVIGNIHENSELLND